MTDDRGLADSPDETPRLGRYNAAATKKNFEPKDVDNQPYHSPFDIATPTDMEKRAEAWLRDKAGMKAWALRGTLVAMQKAYRAMMTEGTTREAMGASQRGLDQFVKLAGDLLRSLEQEDNPGPKKEPE
jgi:hypothetical protein